MYCLTFILATLWLLSHGVTAADLNDIYMMNQTNCNTFYDYMQCTDAPVDYCCIGTMPFW